jgi:hypothetical protein
MNSLANKIVNKSANLTKVVNQAAQNPTPGNLSQVPVAAAGLEGAVRQANVTVNQSNKNAAAAGPGAVAPTASKNYNKMSSNNLAAAARRGNQTPNNKTRIRAAINTKLKNLDPNSPNAAVLVNARRNLNQGN